MEMSDTSEFQHVSRDLSKCLVASLEDATGCGTISNRFQGSCTAGAPAHHAFSGLSACQLPVL